MREWATTCSRFRYPIVSMGVLRWLESTLIEPSFFEVSAETSSLFLVLVDEIASLNPLQHSFVLDLLKRLLEMTHPSMEVHVQVQAWRRTHMVHALGISFSVIRCMVPRKMVFAGNGLWVRGDLLNSQSWCNDTQIGLTGSIMIYISGSLAMHCGMSLVGKTKFCWEKNWSGEGEGNVLSSRIQSSCA